MKATWTVEVRRPNGEWVKLRLGFRTEARAREFAKSYARESTADPDLKWIVYEV